MKFSELIDQEVYAEGEKIAEVKDVIVDTEEWKVTHIEIELTKEASKEILGARTPILNTLAISALGEGSECCTRRGIEIEVSKAQVHIYLRPPE